MEKEITDFQGVKCGRSFVVTQNCCETLKTSETSVSVHLDVKREASEELLISLHI